MNQFVNQPKHQVPSHVTLVGKDGSEFRASRNVLSAASPFFSALLDSDMRENKEGIIRLEHITNTVMRDVLEFMHSDSVEITPTNVQDLIEAADYLLLTSLKTIAGRFIERTLSTANCISIYYYAEKYQCEELVGDTRWFILLNFAAVSKSQDFLNLESQQVEQWISNDEIAVSTEDDVLKIVFKWIDESKSDRKEKFKELFRHVRLAFVTRDHLERDVVTNSLVKENPGCLKLVVDAIEGIHCTADNGPPHPPRAWWHTHIVALTGGKTWCYDPSRDKWYQVANSPRDFMQYSMVSFQGKVYVFEIANRRNVCLQFQYDPFSGHWVRLDWDFSQMKPKAILTAVVRGAMYAVIETDCPSRTLSKQVEGYIMKCNVESNAWEQVSSFLFDGLVGVSGACAVAMDNFLYVIGGCCFYSDCVRPVGTARRFDTIDKKWEKIADMQEARYNTCSVSARGKLFIAGGVVAGEFPSDIVTTDTCEVYNVFTNEWQFIASLFAPRSSASMVCIKGTLYVVGGYHWEDGRCSTPHALVVESYDFKWNTWEIKKKMPRRNQQIGHDIKACTLRVENRPTSVIYCRPLRWSHM